MNQQIKEAWIAALESGEFKQGQNWLRHQKPEQQPTYCCLGVLCELYRRENPKDAEWSKPVTVRNYSDFYIGGKLQYGGVLPKIVATWAGLNETDPRVAGKNMSVWNDGDTATNEYAKSFSEIAVLIRENL